MSLDSYSFPIPASYVTGMESAQLIKTAQHEPACKPTCSNGMTSSSRRNVATSGAEKTSNKNPAVSLESIFQIALEVLSVDH
jgi:hypothetical protein